MLESNLVEGAQSLGDDPAALKYGVSITDGCISIEDTAELLRSARTHELAEFQTLLKNAAAWAAGK